MDSCEISLIWECKNGFVFTQRLKTQIPLSQVDKNAVQESDTFAFAPYSSLRKTQLVSQCYPLDFYSALYMCSSNLQIKVLRVPDRIT